MQLLSFLTPPPHHHSSNPEINLEQVIDSTSRTVVGTSIEDVHKQHSRQIKTNSSVLVLSTMPSPRS